MIKENYIKRKLFVNWITLLQDTICYEFEKLEKDFGKEQIESNNFKNCIVDYYDKIDSSISNNLSYICGETLANSLNMVDVLNNDKISIDLVDGISVNISIKKI